MVIGDYGKITNPYHCGTIGARMKLKITKKGIEYILKTCLSCSDEWFAEEKQHKCSLCGGKLTLRRVES